MESIQTKNKWWHWFERENIPVFYCNLRDSAHPFDPRFKEFTKTFLRHIFAWKGNVLHVYWRQEDLDAFSGFFIQEIQNKSDFLERLSRYHTDNGAALIEYSERFRDIDFSKKTNKEILEYLDTFSHLYYELALYTYIPVIGTFALEDVLVPYLKEKLHEAHKENKYGEYFSALAYHDRKSWARLEEEDLFEITEKLKGGARLEDENIRKELENHAKKWFWLENSYMILSESLNEEDFVRRVREQRECGLKSLPSAQEMEEKFQEAIEELEIETGMISLFRALGEIISLKEYRDGIYNRSHVDLNFLMKEVISRFKLDKQSIFYMKLEEFRKLLSGEAVDLGEVKRRKDLFVWLCDEKEEYFSGEDAEKVIEREVGFLGVREKQEGMLIGNVASPGQARGKVKIVHNESELGKVESGDILVAYMTKPSYLPAMKQAAAFITNEGGITCHAAIVSREMKKPCIIGTKIATQVLHDGDIVEVDANNGTVRIIEKAK